MGIKVLTSILLLVVLGFQNRIVSQSLDVEIQKLKNFPVLEFREKVDSIYVTIDLIKNQQEKERLARKLFEVTKERDEVAHIRSLAYPEYYSDSLRKIYLNQAMKLALKVNRKDKQAWVEEKKCRFFLLTSRYDSAMYSILKLRDSYFDDINKDSQLNITQMLGDVYYDANLYEQAEGAYSSIYNYYRETGEWDNWRAIVVMDNLGQIKTRKGNYSDARKWFFESLDKVNHYLTAPDTLNFKAYIYTKIMESYFKEGRYEEAGEYLNRIKNISADKILEPVSSEIMLWESYLLLNSNKAQKALVLGKKLWEQIDGSPKRKDQVEIAFLLSKIYQILGKQEESLKYLNWYQIKSDSIAGRSNIARSLIVYAENDHQMIIDELRFAKKENKYLFGGFLLLTFALVVIILLYRKLYRSKLSLVNKTLDNVVSEKLNTNGDSLNSKEGEELKLLAEKFSKLLKTEKIYLDADLNIQKVAGQLSTNRSYLSKAINQYLHASFPSYVNHLRIREAIRLIREGYAVHNTQEALATQSGFSNRSVFIAAFKKYTGVTPSFFIKNLKERKM